MRIVVASWRFRLLYDAYARLKDGEGQFKEVIDSYIDLAEKRGFPLPRNIQGLSGGIRNELQRNSSCSEAYVKRGYNYKRPDIFENLESGLWRIRPVVQDQARSLKIDQESSHFVAIPPAQLLQPTRPHIVVDDRNGLFWNEDINEQEFYIIQELNPNIPLGQRLIKVGIGNSKDRLKSLQTGNPFKLECILSIKGRGIAGLESKMHKALAEYKTEGGEEWFEVDDDRLDWIGIEAVKHQISAFDNAMMNR